MSADEIQKARFVALHVAAFTKDEMKAEIYKEALVRRAQLGKAWEAWSVFTLVEHYRVGLSPDPSSRTVLEQQTLSEYERIADREQAEFDESVNVSVEIKEAFAYIDELTAEILRNLE